MASAKGSVLVVEDDPDFLCSLQDCLEEEGYHIETATNGAQALTRLRAGVRPQLILFDWNMPQLDGATLLQELMRDPALAAIPKVVLTADERVDRATVDPNSRPLISYLPKRASIEALIGIVDRYCSATKREVEQ